MWDPPPTPPGEEPVEYAVYVYDEFIDRLVRDTRGAQSVVEWGCQTMNYLAALAHIPRRVGVDIVRPARFVDGGATFVRADMLEIEIEADVGLFIDSLEHMTHDHGERILDRAQASHDVVIVFTPIGLTDNSAGMAAQPDNPHQEHLSGWYPSELAALDFEVEETPPWIGEVPSMYAVWRRR